MAALSGWRVRVLATAGAFLLLVVVLWWVPDLVVDDDHFRRGTSAAAADLEEQRLHARHEARLAAAQAFAFLAVLVGGLATWSTVRQTREGQITDRFAAAVEYLANREPSVRVAAIHALGRIARDSRRDHPAIMSLLGDHLRAKHPWPGDQEIADSSLDVAHPEVKAVALVLRGRELAHDDDAIPIDLSHVDLRAAPLRGVQLTRAVLTDANLRRADLRDADLTAAQVVRAQLSSAYLQRAVFDDANMTGVHLTAAHARETSFRAADLAGAVYGTPAANVVRGRTDVTKADFRGAEALTLEAELVRWDDGAPPHWPDDPDA